MDRRHAIVTGAAGFIGGACVRDLLTSGWDVTALVHKRFPDNLSDLPESPNLRFAQSSITNSDSLLCGIEKAVAESSSPYNALIHCAGRASDVGREEEFRQANLHGVENICKAVKQLSIDRLVHLSTTDVYGVADHRKIDEKAPLQDNRRNSYPKYKILAEQAIQKSLPAQAYTILRPALVWGPGDTTVLPRALEFLRSSPYIVHFGRWRGENNWPLAYVGNVARIARVAASSPLAAGEIYNVADAEQTTMDGYYRILIDHFLPGMSRKRRLCLPFWIGWLIGSISSGLSDRLNRTQPIFDPSLYSLHHISHSQSFDITRAADLLASAGLSFIDRETALRDLKNS